MTSQNSLLGADEAPIPAEFRGDLVAQARVQASSPLQREFAKLLEVIETTGHHVQELERLHGLYRAKFGQILPALQAQQDSLSKQTAMFLHARLQRPDVAEPASLTASHRKSMGRMIVSLSMALAQAGDAQMRVIHDLYSHESIDEMDAAGMDGMLDFLDEMGVELPHIPGKVSAAEMAQAALHAIREKVAHQEEIAAKRQARRDEKRAAKKKADPQEQAKLARSEQAVQDAQGALKNIYRQLARQLHPDRAENDMQRGLNHDLMSEANTAYDRQDLLALLKLQLKVSQIDASAMSSVAEEKLKSWVVLLRMQAKDLQAEHAQQQVQMSYEFHLPAHQAITQAYIEQSLKIAVQDFDETLHQMRSDLEMMKNDANLKRWAKASSRELERERQDALMDDSSISAMLMERMMNTAPRQPQKKKR
jgi:hypothetical protein